MGLSWGHVCTNEMSPSQIGLLESIDFLDSNPLWLPLPPVPPRGVTECWKQSSRAIPMEGLGLSI